MKKILGLDLGTNSIGWALVEVDENNKPSSILAMGSRIISLSSEDRDEFQKGKAITKNQNRTHQRTQRKGYDRKQLRKSNLRNLLAELGIGPTAELLTMPCLELWKLRSEAASPDNNLNASQLGRVLHMLNQKRGYKSVRSEANSEKKDTDYVVAVKGRYTELKDRKQTIGQYFYEELNKASCTSSYFRVKDKVYPREAYIEEFDAIIASQKDNHDFLTEEVIGKLRNEILYYQRKLKSQKGLVNVCELENFKTSIIDKKTQVVKSIVTGPRVAPKTSPVFQLCKIWETVNNISLKIKNPEGSKYKWGDKIPTLAEKREIVHYLSTNSNLSMSELLKILRLKKDDVYASKQILRGIQGNITYSEIHDIIGDSHLLEFDIQIVEARHSAHIVDQRTGEVLAEHEPLQVDVNIEQAPLYQLWHTIYSLKDLEECKAALKKRFNIDETKADQLSRIDFNKQAFGNKSNKAMRKILPYLMMGYDYSQACSLAGYNHTNSLTKEEQLSSEIGDKLDLLSKNSLRQPVVEKILNQMIHVVNAVIEKYGNPSEIRIELARELKQSKDERNEADIQNTFNRKVNAEVALRLTGLGLPTTKRYIQKYKFIFPARDKNWKECNVLNQCIYCGETFNLTEALGGDNFDVDHIVPKALLFDDSQMNKVLVHRSCNASKMKQTAYDYIAKKGPDTLNGYLSRVDEWYKRGVLSYGKMQRLKVSFEEYKERKLIKKETEGDKRLWENFIERQLKETQYISRKAREILRHVCNNVTTTEGNVTSKLRGIWGWDDVLMNLNLPKYRKLGQTSVKTWTSDHGRRSHQREEVANWSKRDDHRHHAIDALVIACTQQGFIQRINTLSASETKDEMQRDIELAKRSNGMTPEGSLTREANKDFRIHDGRISQLDEYLISQRPKLFTTSYVEKEADKILVSHKAGKKVATNSKFKAVGKNSEVGVIVPRGRLHEDFVYGKIKIAIKDKSVRYLLNNPDTIIDLAIRKLVCERLAECGDAKESMASLKQNPIFLDSEKIVQLEKADCYKDEYVIKYKVTDLKKKDIPFIIDEKIRALVDKRLTLYGGNDKEAFKETLWLNKERQIPILTIRCFTGLSSVEAVRKDEFGNKIGFAKTGSNHHIAIYKNGVGNFVQHTCTFWHAVERKRYRIPYIVKDTAALWNDLLDNNLPEDFLEKLPSDDLLLCYSLQQNEMYVLGLEQEAFDNAIARNDTVLLSKYLFLVWSVSESDYWFRHHLETKNSELKTVDNAKDANRYYRFTSVKSFVQKNPIKVRLNHLGEITKIGE